MGNQNPPKWDLEADVVAIGSGIGGLAAAITAVENGASALVLERTELVGGVTALSLGEVWVPGNRFEAELGIEDSPESGFRYLQRLAMGYADDSYIANLTAHAAPVAAYFEQRIGLQLMAIRNCPDYYYGHCEDSVPEGRLLEVKPFVAANLGEWQHRTRTSPIAPYGMTHPDMMEKGGTAHIAKWDYGVMADRLTKDERCLGPGLAAYFVKGALDRDIPLHTGVNVQELIHDGTRVIGVRGTRAGQDVFVKANKGVVVAVSSYERNPDYNKTMSHQLDLGSMVIATVDGANFRLMGKLGARTAKVPDITMIGFRVPNEEQEDGCTITRSAMQPIGLPHTIVVNKAAKRFGNEAFYRQFLYTIDIIDGGNQTHPNFPCWAILDSQARTKYPFGPVMPEQEFPEGMAVQADTLAELATKLGLDPTTLEETVARFNANAREGVDPDFGRGTHPWSAYMSGDRFNDPHPNLGTLEQGPFYAVELVRTGGSAIPAAGVVTDHDMRVVGWDNLPIEGLYAAGNSVARLETGAVMQSGVSNARGMVHGYLAGLHVSGNPSTLLRDKQGLS